MSQLLQTIPDIRQYAQMLLAEIGVSAPPLEADACLHARNLHIDEHSLDDLLRLAQREGVEVPAFDKLAGMLDVRGRRIWLKEGMHENQVKFAKLHEAGHYCLPWQRQYLYACSIDSLSLKTRLEWEREANAFAVECLFLSGRFMEQARDFPLSLAIPKALAEEYAVSYESAFRYYVERHDLPCCLLVSKRMTENIGPGQPVECQVRYYVSSPSFIGPVPCRPKEIFLNIEIGQLFPTVKPSQAGSLISLTFPAEIVEHTMKGHIGQHEFFCQSFWNNYSLFTLVSPVMFGA